MSELAPCPFCGSTRDVKIESSHILTGRDYYGQCSACASDGPFGKDEAEATELWNRRSKPASTASSADAKDAARYRWWREHWMAEDEDKFDRLNDVLKGDDPSDDIDAAISASSSLAFKGDSNG